MSGHRDMRPDITAAELARLTGITDRHARRLVNGNRNPADTSAASDVRADVQDRSEAVTAGQQ